MSRADEPAAAHDPVPPLAFRVGQEMLARDEVSRALGLRIEAIGTGTAHLSMTVRHDMLNGHATCHGGIIFTLADSAFAFACNSRNEVTVAAGCSIEFLRPVREGEVLSAVAQERSLSGRSGIYDVSVVDASGTLVALFRGKSAKLKGAVLPDAPESKRDGRESL